MYEVLSDTSYKRYLDLEKCMSHLIQKTIIFKKMYE